MYPVMLDVTGRSCLVVGAGPVGARKTLGLLDEGAIVTVVAPIVHPTVVAVADRLTIKRRGYETSDLDEQWLVIAATADPVLQQRIYDEANTRRLWANCADEPDRCAFYLPAVVRRGPVVVSVSTSGSAPSLAQWLRDRLAGALPDDVESLARALSTRRAEVQARGQSTEGIDWRRVIEELAGNAAENDR